MNQSHHYPIQFESMMNDWIEDGEIPEMDLEELDNLDSLEFDEDFLLRIASDPKHENGQLQSFLDYLANSCTTNGYRRIASLIIRIQCVLFRAANIRKSNSIMPEWYWILFAFCDLDKHFYFNGSTIVVGTRVHFSFFPEDIPEKYRDSIKTRFVPLKLNEQEGTLYHRVKARLESCPTGNEHSRLFEQIGYDTLCELFPEDIGEPIEQSVTSDNLLIRDMVFRNRGKSEFWRYIKENYRALYIVVDFKNYGAEIGQDPIRQMNAYLNNALGNFGILWARNGGKNTVLPAALKNYRDNGKLIIVIDDSDVLAMSKILASTKNPGTILQALFNKMVLAY